MREFTHITITPNAFDLNNNFTEQMDEALRQEKIARAATELLEALKAAHADLDAIYKHCAESSKAPVIEIGRFGRLSKIADVIAKAEGKQ